MNLRVPKYTGNLSTSWAVIFSRGLCFMELLRSFHRVKI
jgi:hypothetical protein